jgi:hypothetical protein
MQIGHRNAEASTSHVRRDCRFMNEVWDGQRRFWIVFVIWLIGVVLFLIVATQVLRSAPDSVVMGIGYGSVLLLYIPMYGLAKLKCPHCGKRAGATPFFRYKFLICRSCSERMECP